jgi:hypothetical protein
MNGGEREITVETNSSVDRTLASLGARRSVPFKEVEVHRDLEPHILGAGPPLVGVKVLAGDR